MSESNLPDHLIFHGNGGSYPPHGVITATDHGPAVVVASWIMVCLLGLAIGARFGTRPKFGRESVSLGVASILALLQSVMVHLAVNHGLGRHRKTLSLGDYTYHNKVVYTSQILKISTHYLPTRRSLWGFILLLTLWAGATIITYATQCKLPKPWDLSATDCYDQEALYLATGVINIVTDLAIVAVPIVILRNVQIKLSRKITVYMVFVPRILVCVASALELAYLPDYIHNDDKTWFLVESTIWGQVAMTFSIITACAPMMKPLFDMLQFSLIDSAIPFAGGNIALTSFGARNKANKATP